VIEEMSEEGTNPKGDSGDSIEKELNSQEKRLRKCPREGTNPKRMMAGRYEKAKSTRKSSY